MKKFNFKLLKRDIYENRYALFIIILYIILMQIIFKSLCPVKVIFHIPCPGCGLTHAFISLLKGNILKSIKYNASLIFWLLFFILFFYDRYFRKLKFKVFPNYLIFVCIFTIVLYFIKFIY